MSDPQPDTEERDQTHEGSSWFGSERVEDDALVGVTLQGSY